MNNQTTQTKDESTSGQNDAKAEKQPKKQEKTTSKKTSSEPELRGNCPPGQTWNPTTGQCE